MTVFEEDDEEVVEFRFRLRRKEKGLFFEDDEVTAESLLETATREEGWHAEIGDGGTELALSYSLGVVVVMERGVVVPGVDETEDEGSRRSLLRFELEDEELRLAESGRLK